MNLILRYLLSVFLVFIPAMGEACANHSGGERDATGPLPGDSIYQLSSNWLDQDGRRTSLGEFAGRPRLIAMIFTKCQTACPLLVQDLRGLENSLTPEERDRLKVDLFSFDSKRETPITLKDFAGKYKFEPARWSIHAGNAGAVSELAAVLGVQYKELQSGDFVHANLIFLVNAEGQIIAKKAGLKTDPAAFVTEIKRHLKPRH